MTRAQRKRIDDILNGFKVTGHSIDAIATWYNMPCLEIEQIIREALDLSHLRSIPKRKRKG